MKLHSLKFAGLAVALSAAAGIGGLTAVVAMNVFAPRPAEAQAQQESRFDAILKR